MTAPTFPTTLAGYGPNGLGVVVNGLSVNGPDGLGANWSVDPGTFSGWDGSTASSVQLTQKARAAGAWTSPRNLSARTVSVGGTVSAADMDGLQAAMDRLVAACALEDFVMSVQRGSTVRSMLVARQDAPMFTELAPTVAQWSIQVVGADPRKFATALSATTALPSVSGGVTVPLTVPLVITSSTVSGAVTLTNPGNATGPVLITIRGPVTGPVIRHVGSGLQLVFASSLTLAAGEFLLVDMEGQVALANGQASRNNTILNRGWSGFEPGVNTWQVDSGAYNSSARFTVSATPSWA